MHLKIHSISGQQSSIGDVVYSGVNFVKFKLLKSPISWVEFALDRLSIIIWINIDIIFDILSSYGIKLKKRIFGLFFFKLCCPLNNSGSILMKFLLLFYFICQSI